MITVEKTSLTIQLFSGRFTLGMDLEDAGSTVGYLIRDRDAKSPALFDQILGDAGIQHSLREFEQHDNARRPHQALNQDAPLRAVPEPITDPGRIARLEIRRHDRLGGVIHEYRHTA